jgi:hypothetical protein
MAPLTKIVPPMTGHTPPPIQSDGDAVSLQSPEIGMVLRRLLLVATDALGLRVTDGAGGIGLETVLPDPFTMILFPREVVTGRLCLSGSSVVMTGGTFHSLL